MKMSVFSTGDGYGARVGDFDPVIAGYDFALTRVDPEYIYVGFFASRSVTISVRDIQLEINHERCIGLGAFDLSAGK